MGLYAYQKFSVLPLPRETKSGHHTADANYNASGNLNSHSKWWDKLGTAISFLPFDKYMVQFPSVTHTYMCFHLQKSHGYDYLELDEAQDLTWPPWIEKVIAGPSVEIPEQLILTMSINYFILTSSLPVSAGLSKHGQISNQSSFRSMRYESRFFSMVL
jgi:hypothetical protein